MTYEQLKHLKSSAFKRRCGVHPETFDQMVEVLRPELDRRVYRVGQAKLGVEDQLLVVLEYWREYRTQFHIGSSWGLSESAVCRLIARVESLLMASGKFRLPGKKQLHQDAYTSASAGRGCDGKPEHLRCSKADEHQKKTKSLLQWQKAKTHAESASASRANHRTNSLHRLWQRTY